MRQILEEIRSSREETNRRFEAMQAQMDRRFESMDRRFEAMDHKFESLVQEMHKGFELQSKATRDLGIKVDTVGARWGVFAESTIRNTLKELLLKNLNVTEVKEWKAPDKDGFVFGYPQEIQGDLLIKNGENYLVEIKSSASSGDVTILHRKGKLYEQITSTSPKLIFVAMNMKEEGKKSC